MNKGNRLKSEKEQQDLTRLLLLADKNLAFIATLSAATGMHLEDILELTVQDLSGSFVYISQESGPLKYPVPTHTIQKIIQPLIKGRKLEEPAFIKKDGELYTIEAVLLELENAAKQLGIHNFGTESIRKWYFYNVWKIGKEKISIVQEVCGFETEEEAMEYIEIEHKSGLRKLFPLFK